MPSPAYLSLSPFSGSSSVYCCPPPRCPVPRICHFHPFLDLPQCTAARHPDAQSRVFVTFTLFWIFLSVLLPATPMPSPAYLSLSPFSGSSSVYCCPPFLPMVVVAGRLGSPSIKGEALSSPSLYSLPPSSTPDISCRSESSNKSL